MRFLGRIRCFSFLPLLTSYKQSHSVLSGLMWRKDLKNFVLSVFFGPSGKIQWGTNKPQRSSSQHIRGYSKKSVSWAVHLFFVYLYCCFIQKWCINNDWKYDFWLLRCLFYQVESILFHFQQLQIFVFQKFPWNTAKMVKNLQCLKTPEICYLTHAEHHAKNRTSLRGLDYDTLFFE